MPAAPDHFALFGLPRRFDLDPGELQTRYLELARQTHPDFARADAEAQLRAVERSAAVNEAHSILADPELRGNYLLELLGGPHKGADASLPPGFLEEVMDLRESLAEAAMNQDQTKLADLRAAIESRRTAILDQLSTLFDQAVADPAALPAIRQALNALRYVQRMMSQ